MQGKPDYYAILGLTPNATAADIESAYHAITQHLDPQKQPPNLRRWAEGQLAMVDEAYAALTEGLEEEVELRPAQGTQQNAAQAAPDARGRATPITTVSRRPSARQDEEYDDYEDEDDDGEDDIVERPRQQRVAPAAARAPKGAHPAPTRAAYGKAEQGRGRKRNRGRGRPVAPAYREPVLASDDRIKKLLLGLGAGLVVVVLAYFITQSGGGLFGSASPNADQFAADQPAQFDQARYEQLKAMLRNDPQNYAVLFELGEMNFQSQRYAEAIDWFTKVLAVRPDDVHAMQDIGTASFNTGNRDLALQMWQRALEVDPNDGQTHWNLSFYYATAQPPDLDAAMREWQKVVELEPGSDLAKTAQQHIDSYKSRLAGGAAVPTPQR
jgi:tetratricopeptide (TPR) repeat protein